MHHHTAFHDPVLVALSILIAALASYTALDLATRMRAASGRARRSWLVAAAIAMGGGIWSMHFVGMLAFSQPGLEISYDPFLTLLSLAIPIVVAAAAFAVVGRRPQALLVSGFAMGLGISGMHYTGMAAMRMAAITEYESRWVVLSILIAISASVVALWLAFRNTNAVQRLFAGLVMGLAISGMHYAAMQGAMFLPTIAMVREAGHLAVGQAPLAFLLAGITILILSIGIAAAVYDRASAERAQYEADTLRRSEERFRLLVEGIADHAIFMLDPDGRVGNWNLGARRLMGYGDDIVGTSYSIFHTEEDCASGAPGCALVDAERDGKSAIEGWRVRKDGSRFWAEATIVAVRNESGAIAGFAKIVRDVSERRRAQEALDRAREALMMSQKMETIGQLTGGVAHDFNNLLAAVLGSLELLKKRLPPGDPKIQRLVENAMQGAVRGASLTQRMLAFARKQDLRPAVVDVRDLVRGMASLLKFEPGIRVETLFPMHLPKVTVDANQLELAVLNLAVNARDAMPDGGLITIAAREEQDGSGLSTSGYVALSVSDTGCGMDDQTLRHAQEPFFTTKGVGKGTGLGLSMVHGLAEQSGGRLVLKSRPGEGTTADIWLPIAEETAVPEPRTEAPAPIARASRQLSVLVVDDDLLVLENTAAMLEDLGHIVVEARSGDEALALLRRTRTVDLIVTDYAMPGMTGLQLASAVAAERPETVILMSTGYADIPSDARSSLPRLSKPFDQAALARAIEAAMGEQEATGSIVAFRPKSA
ncbi:MULTISPECIES: MHYT domain-containing protein [unclassified Bradyrhizobium]|uniref:MHYT domain-containing protein n=1 Tax=unclassified Bradyrhizobium TaxID=2631580 RepID=UPI001FFB621A|nr:MULTISPECIES: MHYT domain-containing protein [unclassified Bradyrhizobium]MCK1711393.1 response regulator [Bradyrhizobium sp. 143]MCK1731666.1 response regulator [Bradyrhizobium sp. 142]